MNESPRWLDRLAHDLRGPLMPLQTATYLLKSGQLGPERQQELLNLIQRQTQRLAHMIEEFDDWSRAECGSLLGERVSYEASLLLDIALGNLASAATMRPSILDESGEASVLGDQARLIQLFRILVEHANARSCGQTPSLHLHLAGGVLRIDVVDDRAPGGQLATLLHEPQAEPFDEGLGLKLLIASAIAQAHGGTLAAEADPAGGLRLRCGLPLA